MGLTAMFLYKSGFRKYRVSCYFPIFFRLREHSLKLGHCQTLDVTLVLHTTRRDHRTYHGERLRKSKLTHRIVITTTLKQIKDKKMKGENRYFRNEIVL